MAQNFDFSNQIEGLQRIAEYMTEGKWVLAKIAAVQPRFPELPDNTAVRKVIAAEEYLAKCRCQTTISKNTRKRDVSSEPRVLVENGSMRSNSAMIKSNAVN
jgi:hypothetical protein